MMSEPEHNHGSNTNRDDDCGQRKSRPEQDPFKTI